MTGINIIQKWYNEGKKCGHKFMTVVCDTFDWGDYPVYGDKPHAENRKRGERVMEVYDLSIPFKKQNGNDTQRSKNIISRIEIRCDTHDGRVYRGIIDYNLKNYDKEKLKDFSIFVELKIRDYVWQIEEILRRDINYLR